MKSNIKVGSVIEFTMGYNEDIRDIFTVTKIVGQDIYVDWDCHWFPIQDDSKRNIKVIKY